MAVKRLMLYRHGAAGYHSLRPRCPSDTDSKLPLYVERHVLLFRTQIREVEQDYARLARDEVDAHQRIELSGSVYEDIQHYVIRVERSRVDIEATDHVEFAERDPNLAHHVRLARREMDLVEHALEASVLPPTV
jgi:hypothetical protein